MACLLMRQVCCCLSKEGRSRASQFIHAFIDRACNSLANYETNWSIFVNRPA